MGRDDRWINNQKQTNKQKFILICILAALQRLEKSHWLTLHNDTWVQAVAALIHISSPSRTQAEEKTVSDTLFCVKEKRTKESQRFTVFLKALACTQLGEFFSHSTGQSRL